MFVQSLQSFILSGTSSIRIAFTHFLTKLKPSKISHHPHLSTNSGNFLAWWISTAYFYPTVNTCILLLQVCLKLTETKYSIFSWKLTIVYLIVKPFWQMLEGHVFTNYKLLVYAINAKPDCYSPGKVWHLNFISQYTADISHIKGANNSAVDVLSCIELNTIHITATIDLQQIAANQQDDKELLQLWNLSPFRNHWYPLLQVILVWHSVGHECILVPFLLLCIPWHILVSMSHKSWYWAVCDISCGLTSTRTPVIGIGPNMCQKGPSTH